MEGTRVRCTLDALYCFSMRIIRIGTDRIVQKYRCMETPFVFPNK